MALLRRVRRGPLHLQAHGALVTPLFFDFISPYAYLAWRELRDDQSIEPTPIVFGVLLDHHANVGPAEVPAKRRYVFVDCVRKAHKRGVPFAPPPAHPFNPLLGLRVCLSERLRDRRACIDRLFDIAWGGRGGALDDTEHVRAALDDLGEDSAAVLDDAGSAAGKGRLKETTARAIELGVFGVPSLVVNGEVFWGLDSIEHARDRRAGRDPIDDVDLSRWADLPASARRKRAP